MATTTLRAMCDQARRLLEQNDIDRSIAVAQHILQYFPDNLEAHRILGEAYLASRQFDQAQESFSRVLYADPENIPALVGLGITYERQGKIDRAVREFEQALEIKSDLKELREQLLRLYTDSWGAERAQLRLSKPGLARLYAKGHMFPQAIQEFRSVINDDPDRFDARVGLAEVLWRDGQEEAAALVCEEILAQRDVVLKANLLLGYMKLTAGDPQGQHYWNVAQRLDPYQGVALALFETLPTAEEPQTTLPDWDEKAWLERQEQAERERRVQLEEELAVRSPVVQPDEDFLTNAWLDPTEEHPHSTAATTFDTTPDDDFLASLLAFEALDQPELAGVTDQPQASVDSEYAEADLKPFTLDDLDHPEHQVPAMQAAPEFPSESDFNLDALLVGETATEEHTLPSGEGKDEKTEFQPFSLDDLGISDEDIAVLDMASELSVTTDEQPPVPVAFTDESSVNKDLGVQPFSLNDLGLSDEELAGLDLRHTDAELYPGAPSEERQSDDDLTNLKPFDWSQETGFSAAQLANDQVFESDIDDLQPFSLDDLDLSDSTLDTDMSRSSLPPSLQPFSLDDLGDITLTPDTTSNKFGSPLHTHLSDEEGEQEPSAFGWQQPAAKSNTDFLRHGHDMIDSDEPEETSIFAKLKQRRQELPDKEEMPLPPVSIEKHDSLDLFSDDDVSLRDDDEESTRVLQDLSEPQPAPPPDEPELTPFSLSELGLSPEEIAALESGQVATEATEPQPAPPPDEPELTPFSLSELGLSPEEIAALESGQVATEATEPQPAPPPDEPELTPFSLSELGLSPEEIAALESGQVVTEATEPQPAPPPDEPELTPFSLSELGLSPEEIAALGMSDADAVDSMPSIADEVSAAHSAPPDAPTAQPDATPFPFEEWNLDDDNFSGLNTGIIDLSGSENQSEISEPLGDIQPFSLSDLGLVTEESGVFGAESHLGQSELGLTEEELANLNIGMFDDHDHSREKIGSLVDDDQELTGDFELDKLIRLGRKQGFVDLTDIIEIVHDPVAQPERIEEIGQALHLAGIQIRDGDEIIDMDEEYLEEEDIAVLKNQQGDDVQTVDTDEPDLAPFSLGDLGLSAEEIAALGLEDDQSKVASPVAEPAAEPELTPFSLEELGLTPEEIAALAQGEQAPATLPESQTETEAPAAPEPAAEPELTPFSLEELGLTPEEIAALAQGEQALATLPESQTETEAPAAPEPAAEPELTPLSLEELGLTPEEIAFLRSGTTTRPSIDMLAAAVAGLSASKEQDQDKDEDAFDFSVVDKHRDKLAIPVKRTEPRKHEEEVRPVPPEDADFKPEALDTLDNIWEMVDRELAQTPVPSAVAAATRPEPPPTKPVPAQGRSVPTAARPTVPARSATQPDPMVSQQTKPAAVSEHEHHTGADTTPSSPKSATRRSSWRKSPTSFIPTGDETLDEYLRQVEVDPNNHGLRLGIARLAWQTERNDLALYEYKHLIKDKIALDRVVDELQELIEESEDRQLLQRLYRLLGDAYSQQNRFREAIAAYSWTFTN